MPLLVTFRNPIFCSDFRYCISCSYFLPFVIRIVRTCCQMGLETHSPYQEKLLNLCSIQEQEQMQYVNSFLNISCLNILL